MSKQYIWDYFKAKIGNEYGVAALMGNLQAESGLCPYRLQGDFSSGWTRSIEYTNNVNSGAISEYDFVHNGPSGGGYGLAQWTFYTRKQGLYNMWKSGGYSSIGSIELACDYLWYELQNSFKGVLSTLKSATSIRQASDKVLHDFENPADQSTSVEEKRASMGQAIYNEMHGTSGGGNEGGGNEGGGSEGGGNEGGGNEGGGNSGGGVTSWVSYKRKYKFLLYRKGLKQYGKAGFFRQN